MKDQSRMSKYLLILIAVSLIIICIGIFKLIPAKPSTEKIQLLSFYWTEYKNNQRLDWTDNCSKCIGKVQMIPTKPFTEENSFCLHSEVNYRVNLINSKQVSCKFYYRDQESSSIIFYEGLNKGKLEFSMPIDRDNSIDLCCEGVCVSKVLPALCK